MGRYDDREDNFGDSGPTHLTQIEIDWDNDEHRRCITACLVKGTYVLERDRTKKRENTSNALAPAWWETFHFRKLHEYKLEHACKCVICETKHMLGSRSGRRLFGYGAVFEYTPAANCATCHPSAPSHIVAFRGTMTRDPTILKDMCQNLRIMVNKHHMCGRFMDARQNVQELLDKKQTDNGDNGAGETWLAGHSLGASIALDVGRHMMMIHQGLNLPTFLFNPPHASLAPVIPERTREEVYAIGYFLKCALSIVTPSSHKNHMEEVFEKLKTWAPNVYVNPLDDICEGYIHYFEERERMMDRHPSVAMLASKMSFRDMWNSMWGKQTERPHLLPFVTVEKHNVTRSRTRAPAVVATYRPAGLVDQGIQLAFLI